MDIKKFLNDFELLFDDIESGSTNSETKFRDIDEWSSLTALMLISMADQEYDVRITGDDIRDSITVKDLFDKFNS